MMNGCNWALGAALATTLLLGPAKTAGAEPGTLEIDAVYKVTLNDFEVGNFSFKSQVGATGYNAESDVKLSVAGLVGWKGRTAIRGSIQGKAPSPKDYDFKYDSPAKSGSIAMNFDKGSVTGLTILPQEDPLPDTLPLTAEHIKGVMDPLSAVLAMVRVDGKNPCDRKVSIFDGKQRFDLVLSYRKETRITEVKPSGQPGTGIICKVKYVPIAGYRPTEEVMSFARTNGITITFRPIPSANLMVPHAVVIPTMAGEAVLSVSQVKIKAPNQGQIALIN